jgi:hypothetical protein
MLEQIHEIPGDILDLDAYMADFSENESKISDRCNKLERRQYFEEPYDPSWRAFAAGDWEESLRLDEELARADTAEMYATYARRGIEWRRVRVVELPVTPYVQWELHGLKLRVECGEHISVIPAESVSKYEIDRLASEVIILGSQVMYEVLYDKSSVLCGGRRINDQAVIQACRSEIEQLYSDGEDFIAFFKREVAHLPAPTRAAGK